MDGTASAAETSSRARRASSVLLRGFAVHLSRVLTRRSVVAVVAVGAIGAAVLPAGAATTTTPAHGKATSTLSILQLHIAGQSVTAGLITATAVNSTSPHIARLVVTPLAFNFPAVGKRGTIGKQTITPASGSTTVPGAAGSVTLPNGLGSVTGPTFVAEAKDTVAGVLATTRLTALGKLTLAGVPLNLRLASLNNTAQVVASNATAEKSFSLGDLSLPSIAALLASLGLDLTKTVDQLTQGKLTQLAGLVTTTTSGAVKSANDAVDAAQAGVQSAGGAPATTLNAAIAQASTAQADATQANSDFDAAWSAAYGALGPAQAALDTALATAGLTAPLTAAQFNDAVLNNATLLTAFQAAFGATETTLASLAAAAVAADALVTAVNALVDALQALVNTVIGKVNADGDPIASLGGVKVITKAVAANTPKATAGVSVASIDVLGQSTQLSAVSGAVASVGSTLASVLNSVPGVTFTPPGIAVGTPSKSTHIHGRTRFATASLRGLTVTLPTIALAAPALPLALPGGVNSGAGSLVLGETTESAQWTPAASQTSGSPVPTGGRQLGDTGGRVLLPILATIVLGVAVAVRRRWSAA
jgi:hypothetical protein